MRKSRDPVFYSKLIHLTVPIAFQSLMLAMVAAADAVMLGRLDQNSMAAVSLATQIQFVQNMFILSLVSAASILGAQYWGKGDRDTVHQIFCISLRYCGLISITFFAACMCIPAQLMRIFTHDPVLIEIGAGYLRIASFSYLLTGISQCYLTIMKISEHASSSATISSCTVVINILLNAVFIFGLISPAMGARGAALATSLSRTVELLWAVLASRGKEYIRPDMHRLFDRNPALIGDFRKCALPLLGGALLWGIGFTSYTAVMGHLGADAAAANSIAAVVRDLMCCLCNGISSAGGILVGNELGHGDLAKGREYGDRLMRLSFLCGILSALVILCVSPMVMRFMQLSETAHGYLRGMLLLVSIYMIARCITTIVINGIFAAGGDTLFDMYSLAVTMWGIAVPLSFLGAFVFHWPVLAVYLCTCLDEIGKIPWVLAHYKKYKWVHDLTRDTLEEKTTSSIS